ncbi:hypothetical protein GNZ06_06085 [Aeromonas jandaei]|uniref:hypothetical protein n=1 Tax=Aeromonas jandaei TaxID=650 RepID=UPI001931D2F4|nr:hypothetical protein [Aeromonas jandaei]MBM0491102.1 hypothetical protein [Aeromonas jandaei]MBM0568363.1 hypothetical protein [Aeromonas jandaei]
MAKKKVGKIVAPIVQRRVGVESRSIWNIAAAVSQDQLSYHAHDEALPFIISPASGWPYSRAGSSTDLEGYIRIYHHRDYLFRKLNTTPIARSVKNKKLKNKGSGREVLTLRKVENVTQFSWPTTAILTSNHSLMEINWPKIGILQAVGYRVGDKGLFKNERQKILSEVYNSKLPLVESQLYMNEWGTPKSSRRLYKVAYTIAALVRNAKRKTKADMRRAITDWEDDLSWLRSKYYVDMMWDWPST